MDWTRKVNPVTIIRYNFGRLLTSEHRAAEAVTNFQVALQQRRDLPQHDLGAIHFELGTRWPAWDGTAKLWTNLPRPRGSSPASPTCI